MKKSGVVLLVLAAGESSRMGRPKQLLPIENQSLISFQLKKWEKVDVDSITVVLGANADDISPHIDACEIAINDLWSSGMGSSIKIGVRHIVKRQPDATGILIVLVDQIKITSEDLNLIISDFEQNDGQIIAAQFEDSFGPPALFPKIFFDDLMNIEDNFGAKLLLNRLEDKTQYRELTTAAFDLDTPEQYENYLKSQAE